MIDLQKQNRLSVDKGKTVLAHYFWWRNITRPCLVPYFALQPQEVHELWMEEQFIEKLDGLSQQLSELFDNSPNFTWYCRCLFYQRILIMFKIACVWHYYEVGKE